MKNIDMMYAVEYYAAPKIFIAQYELGCNDFIKNRNLLIKGRIELWI